VFVPGVKFTPAVQFVHPFPVDAFVQPDPFSE
jgi:hypothetical protein